MIMRSEVILKAAYRALDIGCEIDALRMAFDMYVAAVELDMNEPIDECILEGNSDGDSGDYSATWTAAV